VLPRRARVRKRSYAVVALFVGLADDALAKLLKTF
jgi:hypothetical protein